MGFFFFLSPFFLPTSHPLSSYIISSPRRVFSIMSMWCSTQRQSCSFFWPRGCLLSGENATLALNHPTDTCCTGLWEGYSAQYETGSLPPTLPNPIPPDGGQVSVYPPTVRRFSAQFSLFPLKDLWAKLCLCVNPTLSARKKEKKQTPAGCSVTPPDARWNIWIHESHLLPESCSAIRVILVWSMLHRWGEEDHTSQGRKWWRGFLFSFLFKKNVFIGTRLHTYTTLYWCMFLRLQSSHLMGHKYNRGWMGRPEDTQIQGRKRGICVCACVCTCI